MNPVLTLWTACVLLAGATVDAVFRPRGCESKSPFSGNDVVESNGGCYQLFTDKHRSWNESFEWCHKQGLSMAMPSKQNAVQLREDLYKIYGGKTTWAWLSARGDGNQFVTAPERTPISNSNSLWQTGLPGRHVTWNDCLGLDMSDEWRNKEFSHPYYSYSCSDTTHNYALCEGWTPIEYGCIIGDNNRILGQISFADCKAECQSERSFECRSLEYHSSSRRCMLSSEVADGPGKEFKSPCPDNSDWIFTQLDGQDFLSQMQPMCPPDCYLPPPPASCPPGTN